MEIYKVTEFCCKPIHYQDKKQARQLFVDIAKKYWEKNPLDDRDLEELPCGGEQYVADRYLKRDSATIVSKLEVINVL